MSTIGSLFSGYGGLDIAVQQVLGGEVAWYSEIEPAACMVLTAHHPGVPNLGDITQVNWSRVEPVDMLTGGYPCQPFSHAGKRKGSHDERHLWPYVCAAVDALRPRLVVLENVRGHITLGFGDVLADLSRVGYDAKWCVVRASDAGAPHGRARIFITAHPSSTRLQGFGDPQGTSQAERHGYPVEGADQAASDAGCVAGREAESRGDRADGASRRTDAPQSRAGALADSDGSGSEARRDARYDSERVWVELVGPAAPPADANSQRYGCGKDSRVVGRVGGASEGSRRTTGPAWQKSGTGSNTTTNIAWGKYEPAIRRWESITRPAPAPTITGSNGRPRLSPAFVEWMMGLPAGHVTSHGLSNAQALKMLGNGVCPQQAALALRMLALGGAS